MMTVISMTQKLDIARKHFCFFQLAVRRQVSGGNIVDSLVVFQNKYHYGL